MKERKQDSVSLHQCKEKSCRMAILPKTGWHTVKASFTVAVALIVTNALGLGKTSNTFLSKTVDIGQSKTGSSKEKCPDWQGRGFNKHPSPNLLFLAMPYHPKQCRILDETVAQLAVSPTLGSNIMASDLRKQGREVYHFGFGQSPFPVPDLVVQSLKDHAHEKDYLPVAGLPTLRQAISQWHTEILGQSMTPAQVLIGPGTKELMFALTMVMDAAILIPEPSWVSYHPQAHLCGRTILPVHTNEHYKITPRHLQACLDRVPSPENRAKLLILNSPSNPCGFVYSPGELEAIAAVCRAADNVFVLSDEIYNLLTYNLQDNINDNHDHNGNSNIKNSIKSNADSDTNTEGKGKAADQLLQMTSISTYYPEGTIISNGLSKWAGAGGWRLGWFSLPQPLIEAGIGSKMEAVGSEIYSATSAPIQHAAVTVFTHWSLLQGQIRAAAAICSYCAGECIRMLKENAPLLQVNAPQAAFYLWLNWEGYREGLATTFAVHNPSQLCALLAAQTGCVLLPGSAFVGAQSQDATKLTTRLAFTNFDGKAALAQWQQRLDQRLLDQQVDQQQGAVSSPEIILPALQPVLQGLTSLTTFIEQHLTLTTPPSTTL